ncbi:MAG: hypothetical protein H7329_05415 [Opitutaceae bacterium]|nr:hypothetical protein [Cytophagales bacterium]
MLKVLYRISDKGRPKQKLPNASKENCLQNALNVFGHEDFYVFADNCTQETIDMIISKGLNPFNLSLGNSGSWRHCVNFAINNFSLETFIYFLEDDYLHLNTAKTALMEGLQIASYVTLYDHPDKYIDGINPFVRFNSEKSRVYKTETTHWKETNSTTMTFATSVKTITKEKGIWWKFTENVLPEDFNAFQKIINYSIRNPFRFKRKLISALPGLSTHSEVEWISPFVDWSTI